MMTPQILPSVLAADFARLDAEIARVSVDGIHMLHLDVMDGHFVPNISFGPPVIQSIHKLTNLQLDCHLMIENPDLLIPAIAEAGAHSISVHQEACTHLDRTLSFIRAQGCKAGVVLNPATPISTLDEVLDQCDYVLLMSVNPGFGGQKFIRRVLDKARGLAAKRQSQRLDFAIEIDGGITLDNTAECVQAGADWLVAGTSLFRAPDPPSATRHMIAAAQAAAGLIA
jgi:ribulose-phosphate 3-epimerase